MYFITIKKAADNGKPEVRIVAVSKYNRENHGTIYAGVEGIAPESLGIHNKAKVRLLRDGNLRLCPVQKAYTAVTAQLVFYDTELPEQIVNRTDFLDITEIIRE